MLSGTPSSSSSLTPNEADGDVVMQSSNPLTHSATAAESGSLPSQETYTEQINKRRKILYDVQPLSPTTSSYAPLLSVPHACSVNALAVTPCRTHVFTGGSDGFIRRFALIDSLNGRPVENLMVSTSRPPPSSNTIFARPQAQVILQGYWENAPEAEDQDGEEAGSSFNTATNNNTMRFGPRGVSFTEAAGPVQSLIVQDEEMFAIAGSENGNINLYTVRLDEGRVRHTWTPQPDTEEAHQPKAISALTFAQGQTSFVSGGADAKVMQWDLNTGNLERAYPASSQVGSLGFRPTGNTYTPSMASFDNKAEAADAEEVDGHFEEDSDAEDIEAALKPSADATSSTLPPLEPTPSPVKNFADAMNPSLPELSSDVLLCASLDGQVSLYDRRAEDAAMRRFGTEKGTPPWAMQACWSPDGQAVYVGRRNASVNVYDLRAGCKQPRRSVHFPPSSGPVTAVQAHPDNRHLLCGSSDNMRLVDLEWSLQPSEDRRHVHYRVVPGYSSGSVSSIAMDPKGDLMVVASGQRGMAEQTPGATDGIVIHAIQ